MLLLFCLPGGDLLSQDPTVQVPSTLESLTSVFGMGTGVTSPSLPPDYESSFMMIAYLVEGYTFKTAQYRYFSLLLLSQVCCKFNLFR